MGMALLMAIGGLAALIIGGKLLVKSAVFMAALCHVPEAVVGLTIVAVGTSLPELATSVVAARKGETDIAIIKDGDKYRLFDYKSNRLSKVLTKKEINML